MLSFTYTSASKLNPKNFNRLLFYYFIFKSLSILSNQLVQRQTILQFYHLSEGLYDNETLSPPPGKCVTLFELLEMLQVEKPQMSQECL